jgi:hypothetical protein
VTFEEYTRHIDWSLPRGRGRGRGRGTGPLPGPAAGPGSGFSCQVQVVPLIANDVGLAWLFIQVPWKPSVVLPPGAMMPL